MKHDPHAADYPRECAADVLATLRATGQHCFSISHAVHWALLTDQEWAACLALYRRRALLNRGCAA